MSDEINEVKVCGRVIGTSDGSWDQADDFAICLYGVTSTVATIPSGDILINYETGELSVLDEDGETVWSGDLVETLNDIPRALEAKP